jgi:hypothetical protein
VAQGQRRAPGELNELSARGFVGIHGLGSGLSLIIALDRFENNNNIKRKNTKEYMG